MKIVFAINSLSKGGAERVFSNLINYLESQHNEIYLIMLKKEKMGYELSPNVNIYYCDTQNYSDGIHKSKLRKMFQFVCYYKQFKKILNNIKPDIILSFLPQMNFVSLLANNKKYPIIVSARNDHTIEFPNKFYLFLVKWLYPKTSGLIFQTEEQKEFFDKLNIYKPFEIIPNPINEKFVCSPFVGKRDKTIVNVARLKKQKNQELLIKAFDEIKDEFPDYKLIIYGEGDYRNYLQQLINKLNDENRIYLAGNVDDIKNKIYNSSLFVLTSDYEGMPNALMEAMALGLPVISTNCPCGGPKSLITNNENGILIDKNDKEALKKAMQLVLNNDDFSKKISINASKISEKLKPESIYEKYMEFFQTIGDNKR